jgi:hypothetical protein
LKNINKVLVRMELYALMWGRLGSVEKLIENIRVISDLYSKEIGSSTEDLSKVI